MLHGLRHPMLSDEFLSYMDSIIREERIRRREEENLEWERDSYLSAALRDQRERHTIVYTSEELARLRSGQM